MCFQTSMIGSRILMLYGEAQRLKNNTKKMNKMAKKLEEVNRDKTIMKKKVLIQ